jgi:iron complex transport system substrate-binding protein
MKKLRNILLLVLLISLLAACGDNTEEATEEDGNEPEINEEETSEEESDYPLTITDAVDNEITFEEEPEKIVSIIPSNTEIVFALGQGDKVVGVSEHDNYPEEVLEIESVAGMEINVEVIIALEPDVVLANELNISSAQEAFEQIEGAGIDVFVIEDAQDIETTYETIETIGEVIGAKAEAEKVITEMEEGFNELEEITAQVDESERQSVFFENSPAPEIYTAGDNTFFQELLDIIHATNAAGDEEGWLAMDQEAIIELNPDVIITSYGAYIDDPEEEVLNRDGFDVVEAVKNEHVYDLPPDIITRAGPRLVDGAREMAELVYPELFDEE